MTAPGAVDRAPVLAKLSAMGRSSAANSATATGPASVTICGANSLSSATAEIPESPCSGVDQTARQRSFASMLGDVASRLQEHRAAGHLAQAGVSKRDGQP